LQRHGIAVFSEFQLSEAQAWFDKHG